MADDNSNLENFLKRIAQIESSGGKNVNHALITNPNSVQYGSHAIGTYGLMPNTIKEIATRAMYQGDKDKRLQNLQDMDEDEIRNTLMQDHGLEHDLASKLAQHVISNNNGDLDRAAYAWNQGSNLTPDRITQDKLERSPYVQKYRTLSGFIGPMQNQEDDSNQTKVAQNPTPNPSPNPSVQPVQDANIPSSSPFDLKNIDLQTLMKLSGVS